MSLIADLSNAFRDAAAFPVFLALPSTHVLFQPSSIPLAVIVASLVIFFLLLILQHLREKSHRSAWSKVPRYDEISSSILRQKATRKQLEALSGKIDVAVIGSGIGALSSASMLSKIGYKVAVFEKHYVLGGSTQVFEHQGYEFDVGVHYVGGVGDPRSAVRRMFDYLSDGQLQWTKMDSTYDIYYNAQTGKRIGFTDDPVKNRNNLLAAFPDLTEDALDKYDQMCLRARRTSWFLIGLKIFPPILLRLIWPLAQPIYKRYALRPAKEMMAECGLPAEVIGALSYHWGDMGTTPGRTPMFMQAALHNHYKLGAWFPTGGSTSIAKTFVAAILRRGGHAFALAPVDTILTKASLFSRSHKAVGVRIHGVDVKVNKFIVSDAGFRTTFGTIGDHRNMKPALLSPEASIAQRSLMYDFKAGEESTSPCPSYVSLYVGLDVNDADINIPAQNVWHLASHDHDGEWLKMMESESYEEIGVKAPFLFISNESAKDPDYAKRHPGKSTLEVFAPAPAKWFAKWQDSATHKHGSEYEKLKERIGQDLLQILILHFPQIKGHVAFTEVGTPLTVDHYLTRSGEGETYNLDHTTSRFDSLNVQRALHPKTTVKGLFLCGQDALCVSVVGSTMSGLMVSCVVSIRGFLCAFPYFFPLLEMFW